MELISVAVRLKILFLTKKTSRLYPSVRLKKLKKFVLRKPRNREKKNVKSVNGKDRRERISMQSVNGRDRSEKRERRSVRLRKISLNLKRKLKQS